MAETFFSFANLLHSQLPLAAVEKYLKTYLIFQSTAFRFSHDLIFSLRDDHGKDVLEAFSKIIVRSPYVIEIINPF